MKVSSYAVARPSPIDRAATLTMNSFGNRSTAPHGQIVRWTQTLAATKKGELQLVMASVQRVTAATTSTFPNIALYIDAGGGNQLMVLCQLRSNTAFASNDFLAGDLGTYQPATVFAAYSEDGSTGGTMDFFMSASVMTFDA